MLRVKGLKIDLQGLHRKYRVDLKCQFGYVDIRTTNKMILRHFTGNSHHNISNGITRKNTSIGARDAGFGRGTQANEDAQGYLRRNLPARVTQDDLEGVMEIRHKEKSRLEKLVEDPKYSPMEVIMVDREVGLSIFEKLIRSFSEERSNKNSIKVLFLRSTTPFDCGVRGAKKLCVMSLASQKALNCTSLSNSRP
ncbi:hypothetical protein Tco_1236741 [Tanacetum coccineum]